MDMVGIHFESLKTGASIAQRESAYFALELAMERHGVKITHYSLWSLDSHNSGHYKKYGGSWHKKRLEKGLSEIDGLVFCANPKNSNAPSYDWTAMADFSWTVTTSLTLLLPKENCDLSGPEYLRTVQVFSALADWNYGWVILGNKNKGVAPITSGNYSDGCLSKQDEARQNLWYVSSYSEKEKRITYLRDIFHHNYVKSAHLDFPIFGKSLREFIKRDKSSTLTPLSGGLWLWIVDVKSLSNVRETLQPSGLLLSRPQADSKPALSKWLNKLRD